jgi:hypothetical protein
MAKYAATLMTTRPIDEVFAYMSDFSNAEEWDPGTVTAKRLDTGPVGVGSRVALRASALGRESDLTYVVTEFDAPRLVVLRGENRNVVSLDRITVSGAAGETSLTYEADLQFKGFARLLDPVLALILRRLGGAAVASLRDLLASDQPLLGPGQAATG